MKTGIKFIVFFLFSLSLTYAKTFVSPNFKVELDSSWEDYNDLFGLPHVFLGTMKEGVRPSLGVVPTGNENVKLNGEVDTETFFKFKKNKQDWISKSHGKVIEFYPYQKVDFPKVKDIHKFSLKYILGAQTFTEASYYFHCKKELFHLKTLVLSSDDNGTKELGIILNSFECKL